MPVAVKRPAFVVDAPIPAPWGHLVWFVVAGLFVLLLAATYDLDLSPGFF